jgi:hypothetical protein
MVVSNGEYLGLKLASLVHGGGEQELESLLEFGRLGVKQGKRRLGVWGEGEVDGCFCREQGFLNDSRQGHDSLCFPLGTQIRH